MASTQLAHVARQDHVLDAEFTGSQPTTTPSYFRCTAIFPDSDHRHVIM